MDATITENDLKSALPDPSTKMRLPELGAAVDVYRDRWGIPHIRAENEADLFFAQGFATAQDRLWHMDFDRHQALGRWSEYAGAGGVERDRLLRAAGMGRTAKLDYKLASPSAKSMIDAYTAGVNAFLDTTRTLPIEYRLLDARPERWENWHCLAVYKMRNTLLGTFEPKLFLTRLAIAVGGERAASLIKGYPAGHLVTVPPGAVYEGPPLDGLEELTKAAEEVNWLNESDFGSNAWSISGERTASGLPLVAGDSHRALDTPSVYYQIHLSCPEISVIGHSVPGMPGALHFCHNEHVAWGMTYGSADTQDLFIEQFRDTPDGREYLFKGEWREAEVLNETIEVRGGEPVALEVTITHHGPVIAGDPAAGVGVAISDPGLIHGSRWVDAALDAMKSRSVAELPPPRTGRGRGAAPALLRRSRRGRGEPCDGDLLAGGRRGDRTLSRRCGRGRGAGRLERSMLEPCGLDRLAGLRRGAPLAEDAVSITGTVAGIAETGTLMVRSGPDIANALHFLTDTHIAVVDAARIVGAYEDAFALLRTGGRAPAAQRDADHRAVALERYRAHPADRRARAEDAARGGVRWLGGAAARRAPPERALFEAAVGEAVPIAGGEAAPLPGRVPTAPETGSVRARPQPALAPGARPGWMPVPSSG